MTSPFFLWNLGSSRNVMSPLYFGPALDQKQILGTIPSLAGKFYPTWKTNCLTSRLELTLLRASPVLAQELLLHPYLCQQEVGCALPHGL